MASLTAPVVVDIRYEGCTVYIGRKAPRAACPLAHTCSLWCNPYRAGHAGAGGEDAVARFRGLMRERIELGGVNGLGRPWPAAMWRGQLLMLGGQRLGCWCKGKRGNGACHGDVLVELWRELARREEPVAAGRGPR